MAFKFAGSTNSITIFRFVAERAFVQGLLCGWGALVAAYLLAAAVSALLSRDSARMRADTGRFLPVIHPWPKPDLPAR
jgi:hypothetical protein